MPNEENTGAEVQKKIEKLLHEAAQKIRFDEDFWKVFGGRININLETGVIGKFENNEFKETLQKENSRIFTVGIGGIEKDFNFHNYRVHAYSAKNIAGAGIFENGSLAGSIIFDSNRNVRIATARTRLLKDIAGVALYNYLIAVFEQNLGKLEKVVKVWGGDIPYDKGVKHARAISVFSYLIANDKTGDIQDLKRHVIKLANNLDIKPSSCCVYLYTILPREYTKGLKTLANFFAAKDKQIVKTWKKYAHIRDRKKRVQAIAEELEIAPTSACSYLCTVLPQKERHGVRALQHLFYAEEYNIKKLWEETKNIKDLRMRIFQIAGVLEVTITTCCSYVYPIATRDEKPIVRRVSKEELERRKKMANRTAMFHDKCKTLSTYDSETKLRYCPLCKVYF